MLFRNISKTTQYFFLIVSGPHKRVLRTFLGTFRFEEIGKFSTKKSPNVFFCCIVLHVLCLVLHVLRLVLHVLCLVLHVLCLTTLGTKAFQCKAVNTLGFGVPRVPASLVYHTLDGGNYTKIFTLHIIKVATRSQIHITH